MGTQRGPLCTKPGLQKQPLIQEPVQLVEGSIQVGKQDGPQSMYSALGGHGSVQKINKIRKKLDKIQVHSDSVKRMISKYSW